MTNYKRYNDTQRNDPELRAAVEQELLEFNARLRAAKSKLETTLVVLGEAQEIEEDELDQSSGLQEAKYNIRTAIRRFDYKIESKPTPTYIGNVAASMSPEKAEELKDKYRSGK